MKSSSTTLQFFADFIFSELGIVYKEANFYQLDTRLSEIAGQLGFDDPNALYTSAKRIMTPQMKMMILDVATNNETLFFRDPVVFSNIETNLLEKMEFASSRTAPFRIWSAACSYGQEVYSMAMLMEKMKDRLPGKSYEIMATDISNRALTAAEKGVYTQLQIQRGLPAAMLVKYFERAPKGADSFLWNIKSELKQNLTFKRLNLTQPFGTLGNFDLILCRNVLIYQNVEGKKEILDKIYDRLNPGGVLIMGAAESLLGITDKFEILKMERATFFQKPTIPKLMKKTD